MPTASATAMAEQALLVSGQDMRRSLPTVFIFLVSTGVIALTGNVFIVAVWVTIWILCAMPAITTPGGGFLTFTLGLMFLYPALSLDYANYHDKNFVLGVFFCIFYIIKKNAIRAAYKEFKFLKVIVALWVGWALLAYLPVLFASLWKYGLREQLPENWEVLATRNTLLKTTVFTLANVFILALPAVCLREFSDLQRFIKLVGVLTLMVIAGGFAAYWGGINLVNEDYSKSYFSSSRMYTFSIPDANGFGRLLLLPILLFASLSFRKFRWHWLLIVALSMLSVLLTYSRSTYISLSTGLLMVFAANSLRPRGMLMAALLCLLIAALVNYLGLPEQFSMDERLSTMVNLDGRLYLQAIATRIVEENPFFGAFPGGYEREMWAHGFPSNRQVPSPHNMFLGVAVEWGVPMAAILGVTLLVAIRNGLIVLTRLRQFSDHKSRFLQALAILCIALPINYLVHGFAEIVPPESIFFICGLSFAVLRFVKTPPLETNGREGTVFSPH